MYSTLWGGGGPTPCPHHACDVRPSRPQTSRRWQVATLLAASRRPREAGAAAVTGPRSGPLRQSRALPPRKAAAAAANAAAAAAAAANAPAANAANTAKEIDDDDNRRRRRRRRAAAAVLAGET